MKRSVITHGKRIRRILLLLIMAVIGLGGCAWRSNKTVVSVATMTLTLRGMRGGYVYAFSDEELRRYREVYAGEKTVLELESSTVCDAQTLVNLMNTCDVMRWDGFHGKHPKRVKDGVMFRFTATVNGGQVICADGSANFPKGYREFVRELDTMLEASGDN